MKRRQFIHSISAVALFPLLSLRAKEKHYDVVIIGAGLAGLNCALECQRMGINSLIVEATSRVGGRIKSLTHLPGQPEVGGMQIGNSYGYLRHLISKFKLQLFKPTQFVRGTVLSINGQLISSQSWPSHSENFLAKKERNLIPSRLLSHYLKKQDNFEYLNWTSAKYRHLDIPLKNYLRQHGASPKAIKLINHGLNALDVESYSALDALKVYHSRKSGKPGFEMIEGGNEMLPKAMADSLNNPVHLNHAVTSIKQLSGKQLRIQCKNGANFTANQIVISVPFSTLRKIKIDAKLPTHTTQLIRSLSYTPISQFVVKPKSAFWEIDKQPANLWSDSEIERLFALKGQNGEIASLLGWVNGRNALNYDSLTDNAAYLRYAKVLAKARKSTIHQIELIHRESWANNPYQLGAYAHYQAGQVNTFATQMKTQHPLIQFAGEHTEPLLPGMEAAVVSGVKAAYAVKENLT